VNREFFLDRSVRAGDPSTLARPVVVVFGKGTA